MHASYNLQTLLEYQHLAFFVVYHLATSRVTKSFEFTQKNLKCGIECEVWKAFGPPPLK